MTLEERQEIYQEIYQLIRAAENKIKEAERLDTELHIPSINQLRYVAFHLSEALCSSDDILFKSEAEKAKNHCYRAIYDAHEIIIVYYLETVKVFRERYANNLSTVYEVLPSLVEDLNCSNNAREYIATIDRGAIISRDNYYQEAEPYCITLADISKKFAAAEPLLQNKIDKELRETRKLAAQELKETRKFIIQTFLTILAILVTGLGAYYTIASSHKPSTPIPPHTKPRHP
jgi:hypothetical protein